MQTIFRNAGEFAMTLSSNLRSCCMHGSLLISLLSLWASSALSDESYTEKPGTEGNGNLVIGPEYQVDPDLTDRGSPKGKYFEFYTESAHRCGDRHTLLGRADLLGRKRKKGRTGRVIR